MNLGFVPSSALQGASTTEQADLSQLPSRGSASAIRAAPQHWSSDCNCPQAIAGATLSVAAAAAAAAACNILEDVCFPRSRQSRCTGQETCLAAEGAQKGTRKLVEGTQQDANTAPSRFGPRIPKRPQGVTK